MFSLWSVEMLIALGVVKSLFHFALVLDYEVPDLTEND